MKNETALTVGIQGKRLNAGWDEDYLLKVLLGYNAIALYSLARHVPTPRKSVILPG